MKKLYRDQGVNEDNDDVFRMVHSQTRKTVSEVMKSRAEIRTAVNILLEKMDALAFDKITILFSFITKSNYPISDTDLKKFSKAFKMGILKNEHKDAITICAIFLKSMSKFYRGLSSLQNQQ